MGYGYLAMAWGMWLLGLTGWSLAESASSPLDRALTVEFDNRVRPWLDRYCFECHSGESAEASTDIAMYRQLEQIRRASSAWEQIRGLIRVGAMPPADHDQQPEAAEREAVAEWIRRALHEFDCNEPNLPAPVTVRRLNRNEYDATIRDLLGVDLHPASSVGFVSDDVGNGFDNQGEVLSMSPLVLEKYTEAAEWISKKVIVTDRESLREQYAEHPPVSIGQSVAMELLFADGEYRVEARLRLVGEDHDEWTAELWFDEQLLEEFEVARKGRGFSWKLRATAGLHRLELRLPVEPSEAASPPIADSVVVSEGFRFKGPEDGLPPLPRAHQQLVVAIPTESQTVAEAAEQIVARLLPRAYRRPVAAHEQRRIVELIVQASEDGWTFEESLQFGLQAVLMSPDFLFRLEQPYRDDGASPPAPQPLSDYEVANRLSYFLWSSMPDETLFRLAADGQLSEPSELLRQLDRMLADPKADGLVRGFFGQWLGLRNLATASVDAETFAIWSPKLGEAFAKETFLFCRELMISGKLGDILQAEHTYVNPRLADFYQIPYEGRDAGELYQGSRRSSDFERRLGDYRDEERWIRVPLSGQRRGLLTQASILTLTSNPTRTSPVKRGKWVLENILGDPPPPAPPGVPSLEESNAGQASLSLRQQLEVHRENPSCASCHRVLDPIGLGLENFDAIGRWRTIDEGATIDAQGALADGRGFSGPRQLMSLLREDEAKIARHFATQLLTYGLGRGLTRGDQCVIDKIVAHAEAEGYSIRAFLGAVITSQPFRYLGPGNTGP
jgi:hypothetical protein